MAEPTLRDFQFLIQLVDRLVQASFKFADLRAAAEELRRADARRRRGPGAGRGQSGPDQYRRPDVEGCADQVSAGYAAQRGLRDHQRRRAGGTVSDPIHLTDAQIKDAYKALAGIAATSSKALSEFLTGPNGEKVLNAFYNEMKELAQLQADVIANKITKTAFLDKLISYSADTSALALQATNFFTGKTPDRGGPGRADRQRDQHQRPDRLRLRHLQHREQIHRVRGQSGDERLGRGDLQGGLRQPERSATRRPRPTTPSSATPRPRRPGSMSRRRWTTSSPSRSTSPPMATMRPGRQGGRSRLPDVQGPGTPTSASTPRRPRPS
jgi:hypothetical protein